MSDSPTTRVPIHRHPGGAPRDDIVAVEEPIEIQVNGEPLAVLMRTPGDDRALVAGFLLTEGVVDGLDDIGALARCTDPNRPHAQNTWRAVLAAGCKLQESRLAAARRAFFATSSCGLCGKATIDNIHQRVATHAEFAAVPAALVRSAGERARREQRVFEETGGLHAAAVFGRGPEHAIASVAEDIGRHNAVDKVLGYALRAGMDLADKILLSSGRISSEIVLKLRKTATPVLVSRSAPTNQAVLHARGADMTLIGFARGRRFNVYSGERRISRGGASADSTGNAANAADKSTPRAK